MNFKSTIIVAYTYRQFEYSFIVIDWRRSKKVELSLYHSMKMYWGSGGKDSNCSLTVPISSQMDLIHTSTPFL